jgi:hypothetical protein
VTESDDGYNEDDGSSAYFSPTRKTARTRKATNQLRLSRQRSFRITRAPTRPTAITMKRNEEEVDDEGEEEISVVNYDDDVKCDPRLRLNYWSETSWLMMRKKLSWVTMTTK